MLKTLPPTSPRRVRECPAPGLPAPDAALPALLQQCLVGEDVPGQQQALHQLCALTGWEEQNQRQAVQLGAVPLALQLLKTHSPHASHTQAPAEENESTILMVKSLSFLYNISTNEDLSDQVAHVPGCASTLVSLVAAAASHQVTVLAARCLINLTQTSQVGQDEALKVGMRVCICGCCVMSYVRSLVQMFA